MRPSGGGAKIVLSTATLPHAYLKYFRCFEDENLIDLEGLDRGLSIELRDDVLNVEALNEEIECDKRNIVIVNTVRKAREIYKELKCERKAVVHSLMRRKDRLGTLGKVENGGVLIGTQTLEAGLDLDLDALYTELSPIDSLVQRLGRVGRRGPGKAVIYSVEKSTPYLKTLTERTKQVLGADPSALNSWKFVKESVEKVYSDEVVKEIAEKGERMYAEALAYLSELSLFSYPPSREVLLRPSHYAILYIIEGPHRDEVTKTELLGGMVKISYRSYKKSRLKYLLDRIDKIYIVDKEKKDGELLVLKPVEGNRKEKLSKDRLRLDELVIFMEDLRGLYDEAGLAVEELGGEDGDVALGEPEEASKSKRRRSKKSRGR
ncbi:helicase-related protein [Pyrobaculum aerophilum]|uniref:helicase-related protein n=1 Tax=Pyrobaculum aerophilum TaxID=13773 RepID=UPI002162A5AC|nr:helicase-related protein [Pyrobaculum aerophilum]